MFFISPLPPLNSAFDHITLSSIFILLLLSLLSLSFIISLCIRARFSHHLRRFNSLWTVRCLLVLFVALWSLNELLRLPFFRWRDLFPFLPPLSIHDQQKLCKIHTILSLGFFEPAFLVTLLFLVNVSIKKTTPRCTWAFLSLFLSCLPILAVHLLFAWYTNFTDKLPEVFWRSSVLVKNPIGEEIVLCAFPLLNTIIFGAFGVVYSVSFLFSGWKVLSLVINKGLRIRIFALFATVLVTLPVEILFLVFSVFWSPESQVFDATALIIFLSMAVNAAVGEGILVIQAIADWLAAGEENIDQPRRRDKNDNTISYGVPGEEHVV